MASTRLDVRIGGKTVSVTLHGDERSLVVDRDVQATEVAPGEWHVLVDGCSYRVFVAGPPESPWIWHDGVAYRPEVSDPSRSTRVRRRDATGDLSAPMPATVRAIHVGAGDAVARGQTLVVLEAMKMELPLKAPADGVVSSVKCRVGELVQPGVPLVVIE